MAERRRKKTSRKSKPSTRGSALRPAKVGKQGFSTEYSLMLTATMILLAFGVVMVFSASSTSQILSDGSLAGSTFYLKKTLIAVTIGLICMWLVMRGSLSRFREMTPKFMIGTLVALVLVLFMGAAINGTRGWFIFGPVQIQPAEFVKLGLILYGANLLADRPDRLYSVRDMGPYLGMTGVALLLVLAQPDMGSAMVAVFAVFVTLFAAGARPRDLGLLAGGVGGIAFLFALAAPYRRDRLLTFLNPDGDVTGNGFQIIQAKIAIGSGGFDGVGIGNGVQKAFYLPEAHTDMISAVIGEEFGFLGMFALILVYGMLGYAGFQIARKAKDDYGRILAGGLTGLILIQACINLYAVMGMAPLTGVPLPLVSYGNNSLIVSLISIGLILNVGRGGMAATRSKPVPRRDAGPNARLRLIEGAGQSRTQRPARRTSGAERRDSGRRYGGARGSGPRHSRRASR
ncbi:MAG TPA: putative peptidoglycan glycosyltransferase FtsW [Solirubrobacterales bacterium]|nr:putative lipid II flippase FtsW [Solirubrobacterales bacterium]HNA45368.1 putative peptidoglycan glycosyltransferase FtsW [Solirubrobacterales bacterium]HNF84470.1 putative peptidoglycan glycosyltransferase FtsW [Solirubrobacterales bacterium]